MNRCIMLGACALLIGVPVVGQTTGDDVVKLRMRVQELEAENQQLKQAAANKGIGSLGIPYGQVVVIDGEHDPATPIKSVFTFRATAMNGKKLTQDVHLYLKTPDWARSKGTPGKAPRKLLGFQCVDSVGSNQTGLAFTVVDAFMIIDVLEERLLKTADADRVKVGMAHADVEKSLGIPGIVVDRWETANTPKLVVWIVEANLRLNVHLDKNGQVTDVVRLPGPRMRPRF